MTPELIESIESMTVNGNRLELPTTQLTNYPEVKKALVKAGGKYKKNGFEFTTCVQTIKSRLTGGEAIDDKKKYQFFASPRALADQLIGMADLWDDSTVLEPSAGQGAIMLAALTITPHVQGIELMEDNFKVLQENGLDAAQGNFLNQDPEVWGLYDRIIANPPFTRNQDIEHVRHMYDFLKYGGRLVTVMSRSWTFGSQKKQVEFREWLDSLDYHMTELPEGTFKESGTNVSAVIVTINK